MTGKCHAKKIATEVAISGFINIIFINPEVLLPQDE